jgi:CBS domain containing-hemolysin-like protein
MTAAAISVSAVLVLFIGILRAAGASLVRTPRADALHDAAEGNANAERVSRLLEDRTKLQPSLGMVVTGLLMAAAIPATWAITRMLDGGLLLVALALLAAGFVLFGDVVPRAIGRSSARTLAYRFSRLLMLAVAAGSRAADIIEFDEDETEEEEEDKTDAEERDLISSVLEFTDTLVREVMTPRTDMVTIMAVDSTADAMDLVLSSGRSRIPVLGSDPDDVGGILYARDLLKLVDEERPETECRKVMRPPYFVPETKRVSQLLREMQSDQKHLALVIDEFGGTAGLVTIEDLLEEIVGEIADEYDTEEPMITPLDGGGYLIDARLGIDDLGSLIGAELPDDEWDTVGGLVMGLAGRVPREGESFSVDRHVFTAHRVQGRRVAWVRVRSRS